MAHGETYFRTTMAPRYGIAVRFSHPVKVCRKLIPALPLALGGRSGRRTG